MIILNTLYHLFHSIKSICTPSWVNDYSQDIVSPLSFHSNLYVPPRVNVYSPDITSLLPIYSKLYVPLLDTWLFLTLYHLYPSILSSMYPFLGKCLFSRHYITSTPPFQHIRIPSWVSVYSPDIISPLPLHSNLYVAPPGYLFIL